MNAIKSATPLSFNPLIITRLNEILLEARSGDYAVFDWDHTCVFGDCQETVFRYQLSHLQFKKKAENIAASLTYHTDLEALEDRFIKLSEAVLKLKENYSLSELQALTVHKDFVGLGIRLNELYLAHPEIGPKFAYLWILKWLDGYSDSEIHAISLAALTEGTRREIHLAHYGESPECQVSVQVGVRAQPEIRWLMERLREKNIRIYVVTASLEAVIRTIACEPYFGFNLEKDHIKGMRFPLPPASIMTWRAGKVEMIKKEIEATRSPLMILGDSDGDYEMLTGFPDLKLGMIIEKSIKGDIGKLLKDPRYFVQKRNLATGEWYRS